MGIHTRPITTATAARLKDHLGNVRTVINGEGAILQETEYFAFGLAIPRNGTDADNKYLYQRKEKQPE